MKTQFLSVVASFIFFAALTSSQSSNDIPKCSTLKCQAGCALKKLPLEECASCFCNDSQPRGAYLHQACQQTEGECVWTKRCPGAAQDKLLCKAEETCCYFE